MQSRFDPDFYRVTLQKEGNGSVRKISLPAPGAAPVPAYLPENLIPLGPEETFDSETLSDKIDGKAELYFSNNFVKAFHEAFCKESGPEKLAEAFHIRYGKPNKRVLRVQ